MNRRELLRHAPIAVAGAAFGTLAMAPGEGVAAVEVKTTGGRVRGARTPGLSIFKGVPYAGSVAGPNRFKAAPPLRPWTGVRDAVQLAAPAPQPGRAASAREPAPAEECLFLNVWTPAADRRRRPVMFYSHGGGFTTGSGGSAYQDGSSLARTRDVVVVASNHRLGLMGYLSLRELGGEEYATSGNQGLLDIRDALRWVHDNIEAFGGDPGNVMIFGESGGGAKTSCLYAMPSAAPYFNKASIESGPGIRMMPAETAAETTRMLLTHLELDRSNWRKLLEVPLDTLVAAQVALGQRPGAGPLNPRGGRAGMSGNRRPGGFGPIVDGTVLPRHPFDPDAPAISKDKPLIVGYNRDETTFFLQRDPAAFSLTEAALKQRLATELGDKADAVHATYRTARPEASPTDLYIAIGSASMFGIGSIAIAERKHAQGGAPVFAYVFTHGSDSIIPGTTHRLGAAHAYEIRYKFNLIEPDGAAAGADAMAISGAGSVRTARNMSEMWSTFARTGRPAAQGQPAWPAYTAERRATMEIGPQCRVVDDPHPAERQIWERLEG